MNTQSAQGNSRDTNVNNFSSELICVIHKVYTAAVTLQKSISKLASVPAASEH